MRILLAGGAGYIGAHCAVELVNAGYEVVVVDNLVNASEKSLERVEQIVGKKITFYKVDIQDREALNEVFEKEKIDSFLAPGAEETLSSVASCSVTYGFTTLGITATVIPIMAKMTTPNIRITLLP